MKAIGLEGFRLCGILSVVSLTVSSGACFSVGVPPLCFTVCESDRRSLLIGSPVLCCLLADNPVDTLISSYRKLLTDLGNGLTEWSGCNL